MDLIKQARKQTLNQQRRLDEADLSVNERIAIGRAMHYATTSPKVNNWVIKFLIEDLLSDMELLC